MKRILYCTVCSLAFATAAAAQESPPSDAQSGIEEIIVTAQRRGENVQRTALSIQAVSGDTMAKANVNKPEDLAKVVVGVSIGTGGNYPQVYIRGVGSSNTQSYTEGAVAFNLDGIFVSRPWATRGMFYDLERVEVLKGPQGTLYGRNASGGAINVITAKPSLKGVSGFFEAQAGNYDLLQGTAAINLPLGDKIALRASGQIISRDGYLSNGYNDDKTRAARLQLLLEPSDDFSVLIQGNYQHVGGNGAGSILSPQLPGNKWRGLSDPAVIAIIRAQPGIGGLLFPPGNDGFLDLNVYTLGAELNWNLGFATLTFLPAYRDSRLQDRNYVPVFQAENNEHDRQTSAELRLAHESESLKWVLGAYYFNETQRNLHGRSVQTTRQGLLATEIPDFKLATRSYALFGQATYSLNDALRVTGGLRYTYERKEHDGLIHFFTFPVAPPAPPGTCPAPPYVFDTGTIEVPLFCRLDIPLKPLDGPKKYNNVTWKAGVEFDVAPHSMAYANVSTGFKSGGYYAAPPPNDFKPEKLTAYEIGIKNRFFDNRLQLNVEAFYYDYKDHQESHSGPTSNPLYPAFITENAGRAESYGADLDVQYRPTPNDELSFKVQYNKSKYKTFSYQYLTSVFGTPVVGCRVSPPANGSQIVDCAGKQLVRSPTWSGTAGYNHTFDLGSSGRLTAGADMQFASSSYLSIDFLESGRQKSYAIGNLNLTYQAPGGHWSVGAWVQNVTNELVHVHASRYGFVRANNPLRGPDGFIVTTVRPPRTFGGRVRFEF